MPHCLKLGNAKMNAYTDLIFLYVISYRRYQIKKAVGMNLTKRISLVLCTAGLISGPAFGGALTFLNASGTDSRIDRLALTPDGTPWAVVEMPGAERGYSLFRLRYWDGREWKAPVPDVGTLGSVFSASFFGGSDRDVWLALMPDRRLEGEGRLLKLGKGRIEAADTFRKVSPGRDSEIYVARDGRVFNWGESFLACRLTNGVWMRAEASLPLNHRAVLPVVWERDGAVCFFVSPMLYRVGPDGNVSGLLVPGTPAGDRNAYAHRWGADRIVVWPGGLEQEKVSAFDVETLQKVPWPAELTESKVWGATAFSTRDGTLWLSGVDGPPAPTVLLRPGALRPVVWKNVPFPGARTRIGGGATVCECTDGTVASGADGLLLIAPDGQTKRLGWEYGLSGPCWDLQEDREKRLWLVSEGRAVIFDRILPLDGGAAQARWDEVAVGGDTWLFQPQPGEIACFAKDEPVLLRWDGLKWRKQSLPFDPYGYNLHRTDDRGVLWVGRTAGSSWYRIDNTSVRSFPDETAAKAAALAEGARQFVGNCGAASEGTNDPAISGGVFHYSLREEGHFDRVPAVRAFGEFRLTVDTAGTPFAGDYLMRVCEDKSGNLWFLVTPRHEVRAFGKRTGDCGVRSKSVRLFRYTPEVGELDFSASPPAVCGRSLELPLKPGAAPRQRVLFSRVDGLPWERLEAGASLVRFRFPANGVYRCRVMAFDHGGKVPKEAVCTVTAGMELPDTQRDNEEPVIVTGQPWYPPVHAVPTLGGGPVRLLWRSAGEEDWHPVDPVRGLSVAALSRGQQTLHFSAEEAGFWRDSTPLRLDVLVALPLDEYLQCLQSELWSADPDLRARARTSFQACMSEARERLEELEEIASRSDRISEGFRVLSARPQVSPKTYGSALPQKGGRK